MITAAPYYQDNAVMIYNVDCREIEIKSDLILTDPPYGKDVKYGKSYNDDRRNYWQWFLPCLEQLRAMTETMVFTHCNDSLRHIRGYDWVGAWVKDGIGGCRIGNSPLIAGWEPVFCFGMHCYGTKSQGFPDVFRIRQNIGEANNQGIGREKWINGSLFHPCPKPLDLYLKFIQVFGQGKNLIYDPFLGTGATLRAAKDMGYKAIGCEIEERYCEIAANRMSQEVFDFT